MNIKESSQWEESITLLTRKQRVEGGLDGAANIQAKELANRTAWLKDQLEGISDYREYTFYPTQEDPDGTISGLKNTPSGKFFRVVQGINSSRSFVYYMNDAGSAREMASLPGQRSIEYISEIVQRLLTALHVMAEGGTSSGSGIESSDTVQNLMNGFNVLAESINNLSVGNQQNASGLSRLVSSVQICTEMLNTLAAEIVTPDGASQYGYVAFSVPGTVNAGNGSFGTDTRYRRTGMIPVRKGDVVRLTVYTTSATAGHAAALYDSSGAYMGPLGIMCASYAAYQARYYQCEISQDGFVVANTLDQSASSSVDVTGAVLTIDHRLRGRAADAVIKINKQDLIPVRLDNGNINASSITQDGVVSYSTGLYSCTGGRLLFSGLPVASSPGQSSSLYNVVFYDAAKALIAYRPVFSSSGYVIIPENAAYWAQQIITDRTPDWSAVSIVYYNYVYKDELHKLLSSERERLGLEYPNEYYLQDFSGDTDIEWIQNAMDWVHDAGGGWLIISSDYVKQQFIISEAVIHRSNVWVVLDNVEIKLQDGVHDNLFRAAGVIVNPDDPFGLCLDLEITDNIRLIGTGYPKLSGADMAYYADIPAGAGPRYWIGDEYGWRGTGLIYYGTQNFEIGGFKLQNVKNWGTDFGYGSKNGYIHDIDLWQPNKNGDGIHFTNGASYMRVRQIFGYARDDCLAMVNSDDSLKYSTANIPTEGSIRQWIYPTCPFWYGWAGNEAVGTSNDIHDITATNIGLTGNEQVSTILTTQFKIYNVTISGISSVNYMTPTRGWDEVNAILKSYAGFGDASRYKAGNVSNISINNIIECASKNYSIDITLEGRNIRVNRYMKLDTRAKTKGALNISSSAAPYVTTSNIVE
ncbi:putative prophage endo-N-neuraminidase [Klebsiella pneumoniae]|uniref:hypothetical protein n=2 Tax=Klebsiella pneumoniae TaxID=573 RepID=UPI0007CA2DEE|nr:hypothetical protein [Klebsiella pneumoniae]SAT12392.1 putative prophage endo-N-neuraminidase [Klebsiella pneumoniae]HCM7433177.1 hypothetical protein [Klebsiella pneumoniae]